MRDESLNRGPDDLPAAVTAFLRGVERRAFVFLWLQGGSASAAERALAAAIRAFPGPAEDMPMAEWPVRFWKLLLALPAGPEPGRWPPDLDFLGALPVPVRRALLLRQVAGLDENSAAAVIGTGLSGYQQALADACPRDFAGAPDAAGWRRQAEVIQQAGRDLDGQRLQQLRESALAGRPAPATLSAPSHDPQRPPAAARRRRGISASASSGRRRWTVAAVAGLLVLAVAAWFLLRSPPSSTGAHDADGSAASAEVDDLRVHDNDPVVVEPLPEAESPEQPPDWPAALAEPVRDPVIAELGLLSWYAAGMPASRIEREPSDSGVPLPLTGGDGEVYASAAAVEAWQQLDAIEQAQVRAADAALQSQGPDVRAGLRARFAVLDAMERAGWLLGPTLGTDYVALQPLVGFVGEDERGPLLMALRGLTPQQRARLGELSARTPPAGREQLRRELLATPPAGRGAWLEQRVQQ
jgi:hypothetical protein